MSDFTVSTGKQFGRAEISCVVSVAANRESVGCMIEIPPGGILIGLGCDLIEVDRVRGVLERQGERFMNRVFTEEERAYCDSLKHPHKHYAARFAAKEAISKCFTTGIGAEFGWKSASIYHGARHQPLVRLDEQGTALLQSVGGDSVIVSLSHTETSAMAVAAILKTPSDV